MDSTRLDLEKLHWQLDLIADLEPEIVGRTLQEYDAYLPTDQCEWAESIIKRFQYRCFEGFASFLGSIEQQFRVANSPLGALEEEVLGEWRKLASQSDDELMSSAVENGLFVEFFPKESSLYITSFQKQEGRRQLFDPFQLWDLGRIATCGPERGYHLKKIVQQLAKSGPYRRFTFEKETIAKLDELRETSPSFVKVTERITDAICLATRYSKPIRITPILLVGEAGVGKSHYSLELSRCLGVPTKSIAMDNIQEGAGLAGSSFIYSNSQPGEVFKVLTEKDHLSPLVILDELDKARFSEYGDTLGPLHNLLEPVSAKQFRDGSVGLRIDASRVIWIATANHLGRIPSTLQSRFEIFEISSLGQHAKEAILNGLCQELKQEYHGIEFSDQVLDALRDKTPREQRQLLERALARAVRLGEAIVCLNHLEQVAPKAKPRPRRDNGYL